MRLSSFTLIAMFLTFSFGISAEVQASASPLFSTNLSLGSQGPEVLALQKKLNQDPDTLIASTDAGSPGNETTYFGSLTKAAVIRFQDKYAREVLLPVGLTQGSGYVGPSTRAKLNALAAPVTTVHETATMTPVTSVPTSTTSAQSSATTPTPQNPNLTNLDSFLSYIDTAGMKQGISAATLSIIKQQVTKDAATTTDLRAAFLKKISPSPTQTSQNAPLLEKLLSTIGQTFDKVFGTEHAFAAGGTPFGGALTYAFFCNCSGTWLLGITPLPPTYVSLLSYIPGSQAYAGFNIPATTWLLGEYAPAAQACWIIVPDACWPIPDEGIITPMVGSSGS